MEKTLFEKIAGREIPADIVYEDEVCLAFRDISPQAPDHLLIVPKKPIKNSAAAEKEDQELLGHLLLTTQKVADLIGAREEGRGYRLVLNNGPDGGEAVPHLHIHLLAGRKLEWPPG